jgi:hypothetical protein
VTRQGPLPADVQRGDPRLGQQIGPQQLAVSTLSFFSRAEAITLYRRGCTKWG